MQRSITGVSFFGAPVFAFLLASFCSLPVHGDTRLQEIVNLARTGATQLAVQAMDTYQPKVDEDLGAWLVWERERAFVLMSQGRWQRLLDRLEEPPKGLPADFYDWARELRARAFLSLGHGDQARRELGRNVWADSGDPKREDLARWRRLMIEAYLADGLDKDADRSMIRYRQDYGDAGDDWPILRAEVLLRTDRPSAALLALPKKGGVDVQILRTLGQLRSGKLTAKKSLGVAKGLLKKAKKDPQLRAESWALSAESAEQLGIYSTQAQSLEGVLGQTEIMSRSHPLAVTGDHLWAAYSKYGMKTANKAGLLMGDEKAWVKLAIKSKRSPVKVRALFATLALEGTSDGQKQRAHAQLVKQLLSTEFGRYLLPRLYLNTKRFPLEKDIPPPVRHALADLYLQQGRIQKASSMVSGLNQAPEGADPYDWQLRKARILLLAGQVEEGYSSLTHILDALLSSVESSPVPLIVLSGEENKAADTTGKPNFLDASKVDRFLQVVFDLQAIERHDLAQPIFERLLNAPLTEKQRRELYFWSGESAEALDKKREAAILYLRSAMFPDPFAMDPWAQTARFHAAQILADQGLTDDARSLYNGLLGATKDPARKAVLRQRIQQLMLQRQVQ